MRRGCSKTEDMGTKTVIPDVLHCTSLLYCWLFFCCCCFFVVKLQTQCSNITVWGTANHDCRYSTIYGPTTANKTLTADTHSTTDSLSSIQTQWQRWAPLPSHWRTPETGRALRSRHQSPCQDQVGEIHVCISTSWEWASLNYYHGTLKEDIQFS